jgi:putative ABC transport system substrate-binding protein
MIEVRDQRAAVGNQRRKISHRATECAERFLWALFATVVKPISDLRLLISGLCALLLAFSFSAHAQQSTKIPRIGFLSPGNSPGNDFRYEAIQQGLRELGYIEGKTIALEYRGADGKVDRFPELATDLVRLQVDVIIVSNNTVARAASNATKTIPIVIAAGADPVAAGLVASLARPGGNVTGLSGLFPDLSVKRLELLKEILPGLTRVAVLRPLEGSGQQLREMQAAAPALEIQLQILLVGVADRLESAFQAAAKARVDALTVMPDPSGLFIANRQRIFALSVKNRLPAVYSDRDFVEAGGLMSNGTNVTDLFRRTATYVDKILKGRKPADLPVEQPMKFELLINLKTAKALGLTIPPVVMMRAVKVIK